MISSLTGTVLSYDEKSLFLDVHGVGFQIFVSPRLRDKALVGTTATILTHLNVREDALELFGFLEPAELRLFEKLMSVSGVGPRMALGVLSAATAHDIESAIERGDASVLTNVSGVGTKTAQRIIVDLRGKLSLGLDTGSDTNTVVEALTHLGYSAREARDAASSADQAGTIEERIKSALKHMGS